MNDPAPDAATTASAEMKLSSAQMKPLLHLQMLQRQIGDGVTQVVLNVSRGRIELVDSRPLQRIIFS